MNPLLKYISKQITLSEEMEDDILAAIKKRQLAKNDHLISQSQGSVTSTFLSQKE